MIVADPFPLWRRAAISEGWRVWLAPFQPGLSVRLRSPVAATEVWKEKGECVATCVRNDHTPPGVSCTCGVYAATTPALALRYSSSFGELLWESLGYKDAHVYGKVRLLGRVLHSWVKPDELRAERAQLVALYVPSVNPSADVIATKLEQEYGVPAKTVRPEDVEALR
jgi:hypothetical protein